jgi:hypothetical protein
VNWKLSGNEIAAHAGDDRRDLIDAVFHVVFGR